MDELLVVTTGGTIDKVYFDDKSDYQVGEPQIGRILQELGVAFRFTVIPIIRKDSLHITAEDEPGTEAEQRDDEKGREDVADRRAASARHWDTRHHSETPCLRFFGDACRGRPSSSGGGGSSEKLSMPANSSR